jgi:hypothetical protein
MLRAHATAEGQCEHLRQSLADQRLPGNGEVTIAPWSARRSVFGCTTTPRKATARAVILLERLGNRRGVPESFVYPCCATRMGEQPRWVAPAKPWVPVTTKC